MSAPSFLSAYPIPPPSAPFAPSSLSIDEQIALLERGTLAILPEGGLRAKLEKSARTNKPLRVKLGLDPTAPDIHLGFAVVLRKLRQFQNLGHTVVIIIGDYTALIGDPSGRSITRPMLTERQIKNNAATYVEQLSQILDPARTEVRVNSEWLGALGFAGTIELASKMTVAQVMAREDFANRWAEHAPISIHELLYPLAQAYDSVAIMSDIEMGGDDQRFNILAGRGLQQELNQDPQIGLFMPLLVGLDGVVKMSKSKGNYVGILEAPDEMYGKILSLSDAPMRDYFILCTDVPEGEIAELIAKSESGVTNPKLVKQRLAREIVTIYHGAAAASEAEETFNKRFAKKETPDEMPDLPVPPEEIAGGNAPLLRLVFLTGQVKSVSESRRLIEQGGVSVDGEKQRDPAFVVSVNSAAVLKVGKRFWARVKAA